MTTHPIHFSEQSGIEPERNLPLKHTEKKQQMRVLSSHTIFYLFFNIYSLFEHILINKLILNTSNRVCRRDDGLIDDRGFFIIFSLKISLKISQKFA